MNKGQEFKKLFGQKIQILRKKCNLTQMQLAAALGYNSTGMVSQIEKGVKGMASDKVVQVAKILKVNPAFLFSNESMSRDSIEMLVMVNNIINHPECLQYEMTQAFLKSMIEQIETEPSCSPSESVAA
ncbi:MAG: helix-turn-helix domain-containing protein [Planctomycetota bacterium]|jgi:transcriptional regulator with XRE-family HTH domain